MASTRCSSSCSGGVKSTENKGSVYQEGCACPNRDSNFYNDYTRAKKHQREKAVLVGDLHEAKQKINDLVRAAAKCESCKEPLKYTFEDKDAEKQRKETSLQDSSVEKAFASLSGTGNAEVIKILSTHLSTFQIYSAFVQAAERGHLEAVQCFLKQLPLREMRAETRQVHSEKPPKFTPLMAAAKRGHRHVVREMIKKWKSEARRGEVEMMEVIQELDQANEKGWRAIFFAAHNGMCDVLVDLMDEGAEKDAMTSNGKTLLMHACEGGAIDVVDLLAGDYPFEDPSKGLSKKGETSLILSAQNGRVNIMDILIYRCVGTSS
uniref:Uncharacterized protein n=1 Tax=Chromera velia CCMP2878 TaxID=1169474 RepID=A0A0K6S7E4_9ALVE|eukprot:Cvel_21526.t2-p1 / transcript=Cvel_21526.t2 / gene=Cvel_21526 / organism=Chromera_velia_CCMP2878 / gene_product=Putative ankyrin repeat protein MM_0045, putative / transcript_product=Putative ankyrin repeat protein MM_0045, putative / location=Cvel_scaffold2027:1498-4182(+) / protein_length=320 / sequence_SO=supercontig / SO=protein_coding / is_pseudo=false